MGGGGGDATAPPHSTVAPPLHGFGGGSSSGTDGGAPADGGAPSGFSFLAGLSLPPSTAAPPAPSPPAAGLPGSFGGILPPGGSGGGSGGGSNGGGSPAGITSVGGLAVVAVEAVQAHVQPTANIKKKKPGFRPGFAREEPEGGAGGTMGGSGGGAATSSILAGLMVHDDGEGAGAGAGGGGLLAGMQLHATDTGEEGAATTMDGDGSIVNRAVRGSSMSVSATAGAPTATGGFGIGGGSGGGLFMGLGVPPAAAGDAHSPGSSLDAASTTVTPPYTKPRGGSVGARWGVADATPSTTAAAAVTTTWSSPTAAVPIAAAAPAPAPAPVRTPAPAPAPAAPPRSTSPTARMRGGLAGLRDAAAKTRARTVELKLRLRNLMEADRRGAADVVTLRERLARVEAQQDDAMRSEQFEVAESLNGTLEALRGTLAAAEGERRKQAAARLAVEAEQRELAAGAVAMASEAVVALVRYVEDREVEVDKYRRDAVSRATATHDRLANDEEQLRLKEEHVDLDQKLVEEEKLQVARAITDQTTELDAQVAHMRTEHERLAGEVAELERALEAKRREGTCHLALLIVHAAATHTHPPNPPHASSQSAPRRRCWQTRSCASRPSGPSLTSRTSGWRRRRSRWRRSAPSARTRRRRWRRRGTTLRWCSTRTARRRARCCASWRTARSWRRRGRRCAACW